MPFYKVRQSGPWGSWGRLLAHGYILDGPPNTTAMHVARMGPFIPDVTMPSGSVVVVTDNGRKSCERTLGLGEFAPVVKAHVVEYHWEYWDRESEEPGAWPTTADLESPIEEGLHSPLTSDALGDLWQVVLRVGAQAAVCNEVAPWEYQVEVHEHSWTGADLFYVHLGSNGQLPDWIGGTVIVSDRGRNWLEETSGEWFEFEECPVGKTAH